MPQVFPEHGARTLRAPCALTVRMRSLTTAEARVIEALLSEATGDEADRARRSGVPRTTFQTIRRRLLVAGWLHERYVPAPAAVGAPTVTAWLAQPFAERRAEVVRRLRTDHDVVVLCASPDTLFVVSFDRNLSRDGQDPRSSAVSLVPEQWLRHSWTFSASPGPNDMPVYFDYEGEWASRTGLASPISYPQRLPSEPVGAARPASRDIRALLDRPFEITLDEGVALRFSAARLPRRQRRLLVQGWAAHRVLPALTDLPPYRGGHDVRVVFVTGELKGGWSLDSLREGLFQDCRVAPFLAVQAEGRALFAMLSPAPDLLPARSRSVLGLFQEALREIVVLREPLDTLFPLIDHRYDRLLRDEGNPSASEIE